MTRASVNAAWRAIACAVSATHGVTRVKSTRRIGGKNPRRVIGRSVSNRVEPTPASRRNWRGGAA